MDAARTAGPSREIVLLGSTGSIGTQAADIIRRNPDRFRLTGLASGGGNPALLASQAMEFGVEVVAVASERAAPAVQQALQALTAAAPGRGTRQLPKVLAGADAVDVPGGELHQLSAVSFQLSELKAESREPNAAGV